MEKRILRLDSGSALGSVDCWSLGSWLLWFFSRITASKTPSSVDLFLNETFGEGEDSKTPRARCGAGAVRNRRRRGRVEPIFAGYGEDDRTTHHPTDEDLSLLSAQPVGKKVGRYHVGFELAAGGMATVYLACIRGTAGFEKVLALKWLSSRIHGPSQRSRISHQAAARGPMPRSFSYDAIGNLLETQKPWSFAASVTQARPRAGGRSF